MNFEQQVSFLKDADNRDSRPSLKVTWTDHRVQVLAEDSLCLVELSIEDVNKEGSFELSQNVNLFLQGSVESSLNGNKSYYHQTSLKRIKFSKDFQRDSLLLRNVFKNKLTFKAKVVNAFCEGNLDYLIIEGLKAFVRNCYYRPKEAVAIDTNKDSHYKLDSLLDTETIPSFYYYVIIGDTLHLNPTRPLSRKKEGHLLFYYNSKTKKVQNLSLGVHDTTKNKITLEDLKNVFSKLS